MFTGIVEYVGRIASVQERDGDQRLVIEAGHLLLRVVAGDSIAVSGVCLTAARVGGQRFEADVSVETLNATTAGRWQAGARVNLERALTFDKPLGGHLVSGHVDGVARLVERSDDARSRRLAFELPAPLARYVARKGSVTLDGVSLTVNEVAGTRFFVNIIPHTLEHTTLGQLDSGAAVNVEVDLIARYLERLLEGRVLP